MEQLPPWLGNLNDVPGLGPAVIGAVCTVASILCGTVIGLEREKRDKPAGLRTLILISLGSTIFTLASLLFGELKPNADAGRVASQILPGIGFLGAGAIIQSRGTVVGLTTAATIWTVAAVGVTIGSGHVAAGIAFTLLILLTLTSLRALEALVTGHCELRPATIVYRPDNGKTRPYLQEILDRHNITERLIVDEKRSAEERVLRVPVCVGHRDHRVVLRELAELPSVLGLEVDRG